MKRRAIAHVDSHRPDPDYGPFGGDRSSRRIDQCFAFRRVWGVDLEACTWDSAGVSHCAVVDGCFWMGLDESYGVSCKDCGRNHNYCGSLWQALAFGAGPGDNPPPNLGCWSVQLLCAPEEPTNCVASTPEDECDE